MKFQKESTPRKSTEPHLLEAVVLGGEGRVLRAEAGLGSGAELALEVRGARLS